MNASQQFIDKEIQSLNEIGVGLVAGYLAYKAVQKIKDRLSVKKILSHKASRILDTAAKAALLVTIGKRL